MASLADVLDRFAAGDLTASLGSRPGAAEGQLAQSIRRVAETLRLGIFATVQQARMRALGRVAPGAAHELGHLLAIIAGYADLLLADGGANRDALTAIRQAALDGQETLGRLQRPSVEGHDEEPEHVDPGHILGDLIEATRPHWSEHARLRGVSYEIATDFGGSSPIRTRRAMVRELLLTLFLDALEAMPAGGKVGLRVQGDRDGVTITISDSGQRTAPVAATTVFDPFIAAPGLGLGISARIASNLGGSIETREEPGGGRACALRLPSLPPAAPARAASGGQAVAIRRAERPAVLVISADARVADALAGLVRQAGHPVAIAPSGTAGIELYRRRAFEHVITEEVMPDLSGLAISRAIKDYDRDATIALLADPAGHVEADRCEAAGVDRVLTRPLSFSQISGLFQADDENHAAGQRISCTKS